MPHWKEMMPDKEFIYSFNLKGKDVTLTIKSVTQGEVIGDKGKKDKKPVARFEETDKKLALNATNCKTIVQLYGSNDVATWAGKRVTLYPTTTTIKRAGAEETVECVRIRPRIPADKHGAKGAAKIEEYVPAADDSPAFNPEQDVQR